MLRFNFSLGNSNVIAVREFIDIFRDQESPRSAIINHHHHKVNTLEEVCDELLGIRGVVRIFIDGFVTLLRDGNYLILVS